MQENKRRNQSTFLFPLRTNVEYFSSPPGYLALYDRVKQASLLYDMLWFEAGIYQASIGETGSCEMWIPPSDITESMLADSWEPTGGDHYFGFSLTENGTYYPLISGGVERRFRSEFHSILKELEAYHLPWLRFNTFGLTDQGKQFLSRLERDDQLMVQEAFPAASSFLRDNIRKNLNHDLLLAAGLETPASIDPLYAPLFHAKAKYTEGLHAESGFVALNVAVPNMKTLSWETVISVREDPAAIALRGKLVQLEEFARAAIPEGAIPEIASFVSQLLLDEISAELAGRWPSLTKVAVDVCLDFAFGSLLGPASSIATGVRDFIELQNVSLSWVTAFLRLRKSGAQGS